MRKPVYVKVTRQLPFDLQQVWQAVALGFGKVADYNPEIKFSRYESERREGTSTIRHCDFQGGGFIKEEIVEWQQPDYFGLKMLTSSVPLKDLRSKFKFKKSPGGTLVVQEFWYAFKPPLSIFQGLMKRKMTRTLENGLKGLETYLNAQNHGG